ncbi:MAG: threonine/serine exporter family protein [Lachnospiraceae bacterium]|nr:threonine/serine exporter family protein [Lachnospiraceae bacterium]
MLKKIATRVDPKFAKNDYDPSYILALVLDVGEEMILVGAEVSRVEDSMSRMLEAYGYHKINVFCISEYVSISFMDTQGKTFTQSRRVFGSTNDFLRFEELNSISRTVSATKPTVKEFWEMLEKNTPNSYAQTIPMQIFAYFTGGFGFCLFFNGTLGDSVAAGLAALVLMVASKFSKIQNSNKMVYAAFAAFLGGWSALILYHFGLGVHLDKIMISDIMLLVPGMALTISIRDMLTGDIIAGLLRFLEAIMVAGALAIGYAIPIYIWGGMV